MASKKTFSKKELEFLLATTLKTRDILFDCIEMKFDKNGLKDYFKEDPVWKGTRGSLPLVEDLDKLIDMIKLHTNAEETISLYEALGLFDQPSSKNKST